MTGKISQWAGHFEFGQWLTHTMNTRLVVDLGTFTGVSAISFATGNKNAVVDTIDIEDRYEGLKSFHNVNRIIGAFNEYVDSYGDETIDILHIDGDHKMESVTEDLEKWEPKVHKDGIILMHDVWNTTFFGPINVFHNKMKDHHKLMFLNDCGLGIASRNKEIMDKIAKRYTTRLVAYPVIETLYMHMSWFARKWEEIYPL